MKSELFQHLLAELYNGYGSEIDWQRTVKPVEILDDFCGEAAWVILNSGMKEQIARMIWNRIKQAWKDGKPTSTAFNHKGKVAAIDFIYSNSLTLFDGYKAATNKIEYLQTIPFIGKITCWHLAKNLGEDVVKPDRHLVRLANYYNTSPDALCEKISKENNEKKCVVDIILWRACNLQMLSNETLQAIDPQPVPNTDK